VPSVHVNDLTLYFEELGSPDAQPLVLLHGAGGRIDDPVGGWAGLAPSFAEHFHVVMVEHRGHGRTDNPAGFMTFEQIGDDVAALLEHLDLAPVHVAGISDGAVVALDFALRRPKATRSIVVLGGNYCVHDGIRAYAASLDPDALEQAAPEAVAELAERHDAGKYPGYWKELLRQIVANNTANPTWSEEDLRRIGCPTLLVAGENDPFATLDQMVTMKREIPRAEWLIVNHSGHAVHFEHPEIVGPCVLDFVSRSS
jgi:pimeloyl-ACP methyl ester carboxylesterase